MSGGEPVPQGERRPDGATLAVAVFLLVLAGVIAWDAWRLPAAAAAYARIGPRTVPYAVATLTAILGIATGISAFRGGHAPRERIELTPVLWVVAGLVLQIILLGPLGFSIATGAVFACTARAFGRGPLWLSYPIGVVISLAVWLLFATALKLVLPAGALEHYAQADLLAVIAAVRNALGLG